VSAGFFTALGIPLVAGREFTPADARLAVPLIRWYPQQPFPPLFDRPQATPVAVINESMAKKYWPNERALDRRFRALMSPWITIAGVVPDTHTVSLRGETGPEFYLTDLQEPQTDMSVLIRTALPSADFSAPIRGVLRDLDPALPITSMVTMDDVLGVSFSRPRFTSTLLGAFAVMALVLMSAGVYGLVSFTTAQRLPEMGVRIALGAPRGEVHRLILRDALAMTSVGLVAGLAAAVGAGRFISDQLNGVTPTDRLTYAVVTALVVLVVTIACWLPARRASRVDPLVVLRQE
jgi:putative ABC transport system permease protein